MNTTQKKSRYPGAAPFSLEQENIFKGREEDAQKLYDSILRNSTTLLYAKSGYGKSSLINAGLLPKLRENGTTLKAIPLRLGAYKGEDSILPVQNINQNLPTPFEFREKWLDNITTNKNSIWYHTRKLSLVFPNTSFLFIFDQFEELFTYPKLAINQFKKQLGTVLYKNAPLEIWEAYENNETLLTKEELQILEKKLPIKALFAIREDKYSFLNELTDNLPSIIQNIQTIKPLNKAQAEEAIILPAQEKGDFGSDAFTYSKNAIQKILQFLTKEGEAAIESTQLQILCNRLEELGYQTIEVEDIPDFNNIFLDFYRDSIAILREKERAKAEIFIETELIRNANRISLDEQVCLDFVSKSTLNTLVDRHLLRSEPNNLGRDSYELAHDTLVAPILEAKKEREEKEEAERLEQERLEQKRLLIEKAEKERTEKQKIQKQLTRVRLLLIITIIAFITTLAAISLALSYYYSLEKTITKVKSTRDSLQVEKIKSDSLYQIAEKQRSQMLEFYEDFINEKVKDYEQVATDFEKGGEHQRAYIIRQDSKKLLNKIDSLKKEFSKL